MDAPNAETDGETHAETHAETHGETHAETSSETAIKTIQKKGEFEGFVIIYKLPNTGHFLTGQFKNACFRTVSLLLSNPATDGKISHLIFVVFLMVAGVISIAISGRVAALGASM